MGRSELYGQQRGHYLQRATTRVIDFALRHYNGLEVSMDPNKLPQTGKFILLIDHSSIFDALALMVVDPYRPTTVPIVKEEFSHIPVVTGILNLWDPIYVRRDGTNSAAARYKIRKTLFEDERGICVAAEGTRSTSGHLEGLNPSLVRIVLECASEGIPIIPCGVDAYEVFPKGAKFPKPSKIKVNLGEAMDLTPWAKKIGVTREDLEQAARAMQNAIAQLLPPERGPLSDTPALRLTR